MQKIRLSPGLSAALVPPLTALVTALALWCQPNNFADVTESFRQQPVLILLNALPVGLLISATACLFRNVFAGAALTNAAVCLLSIANRVKIEVRDEPVFPRDFGLWKEVGGALGAYRISLPWSVIALVVAVTLCLAAPGLLTGLRPCRNRLPSIGGAVLSFAALYALVVTVYASNDLYNSLKSSSPYRLSVVFNENGFPYNFCRQFTTYLVERPDGYDRQQARTWDETPTAYVPAPDVNVIMVMNEAFSDITDDDAFAFPSGDNPLSNLHDIQSDPHALSLRLVVPGFAGGTANTEFDVFTGMQTNAIGAGTTSAMRTVNRNLDSLFRVFAADGYRTAFCHPGDAWFYNRENVYRWFGASETLFIEEMPSPRYKGRWVTDDYLAGLIEDAFTDSASRGVPLFHASTSIQNHMGYPYGKYGADHEYAPVPLRVEVEADVREQLEVYAEGVRDADAMLGRLRDFFAAREEPVLLAFYGDHLPYLGDGHAAYYALDMDVIKPEGERADPFAEYETPCVIWANDAAAAVLDWDARTPTLGLPEDGRLSAAFLGALILELTGRGERNAWTAFLNGLRREIPVVQNRTPDPYAADILKWRRWSYYKLQQKELR